MPIRHFPFPSPPSMFLLSALAGAACIEWHIVEWHLSKRGYVSIEESRWSAFRNRLVFLISARLSLQSLLSSSQNPAQSSRGGKALSSAACLPVRVLSSVVRCRVLSDSLPPSHFHLIDQPAKAVEILSSSPPTFPLPPSLATLQSQLTDVAALNGGLGRPETQTNVLVLQFDTRSAKRVLQHQDNFYPIQ